MMYPPDDVICGGETPTPAVLSFEFDCSPRCRLNPTNRTVFVLLSLNNNRYHPVNTFFAGPDFFGRFVRNGRTHAKEVVCEGEAGYRVKWPD
jgi:hypothetical protein